MLGIRLGYYSEDPMTIWAIDSIVDFIEDIVPKHAEFIFPAVQGQQIDESKADSYFKDVWDKSIPIIENRLAGHGRAYIGGTDTPSIADFKAF